MKLKLVVASMSVLGLVSCPVFAATTASTSNNTTATTTTTTKHHHHRHHHKMMKHHVRHETAVVNQDQTQPMEAGAPGVPANYAAANYKGEIAPEVCTISQSTLILDETTQSIGRAMPNACNPGWYNRIQVSGGANLDLLKFGNRNNYYQGENVNRFSLNDVYLNVAANVSDWTKAFASLSYSSTTSDGGFSNFSGFTFPTHTYGYSNVYSDYRLNLEQAYATVGNFDVSPFYLQFGKQFQDFSRYEIHPITRSMTQVLSEALRTSVKVGFILPMGLNGDIYAYDDPIEKVGQTKTTTNYGASLGYEQPSDQLGWDVGVGWLYNMMGAGDVAHAVNNFTGGGYNRRADAVAVYGDVNSGPFAFGVRWTGAVSRFNPNDLPDHGTADLIDVDVVNPAARGAEPWAVGADAGYSFEAFGCRNNNVYIGYQHSHESSGIGLPENRWLAGYDIDVFKNTNFGVEWDHDDAYSRSKGGSGNNTNLWSLRGAVKFG